MLEFTSIKPEYGKLRTAMKNVFLSLNYRTQTIPNNYANYLLFNLLGAQRDCAKIKWKITDLRNMNIIIKMLDTANIKIIAESNYENQRFLWIYNTRRSTDEEVQNAIEILKKNNYNEWKVPAMSQKPSTFIRFYTDKSMNKWFVLTNTVNTTFMDQLCAVYNDKIFEKYTNVLEDEELHTEFSKFVNKIWNGEVTELDTVFDWLYPGYLEKEEQRKQIERLKENLEAIKKLNMNQLKKINDSIDSLRSNINAYEEALAKSYAQLQEEQSKYNGLKYLEDAKTEAIENTENIVKAKNSPVVALIPTTRGIEITVNSTLKFWEPDEYIKLTRNETPGSGYFEYVNEWQKYMLHKIWVTKEIIIHISESAIIYDNRIEFVRENYTNYQRKDYYVKQMGVPNPHHAMYNCWGDNKTPILKYNKEANYDLMIQQIISAISTINVVDSAVFKTFIDTLIGATDDYDSYYNNGTKAFEYKGNRYTLGELKKLMCQEYETAMSEQATESEQTNQ